MQISGLSAASTFGSTDVLAIEVGGTTYKLTGATLATALKSIGSYLTTSAVANNVTTTDSGYVLDARQGKTIYDMLVGRITNASQGSYSTRSEAAAAVWGDMTDGTIKVGRFVCSSAYVYLAMRNSANYATLICFSYGTPIYQIDKVGGGIQGEKTYSFVAPITT